MVEADPVQSGAPAIVPAISFETRTDLPQAILRVVERTLESVVLADAAVFGLFQSDRYIVRRRPKSVLCMPIVRQDKLTGILYLENNLITNGFTPDRCELLETLCVQAGISIENARLYEAFDIHLKERTQELSEIALRLKETQKRLFMQEKLASLGALASGIAHEIKNPLNFVTNFAELSVSIAAELSSEIEEQKGRLDPKTLGTIHEMIGDLQQNSEKIQEHGKRADGIVKAMLDHGRVGGEAEKRSCDIHALLREYVTLAYQGIRAQNPSFHVIIETSYQESLPPVHILPQDIGRVILNLIQNGCYAVDARKKEAGQGFSPMIKVSTREVGNEIEIRVRDNGGGVPDTIREKIFQAFFTTKPPGEGTGLGLSISHEIVVQGHGGTLRFESEEGQYTEFIVTLPAGTEDLREST
jgi:signal transduction histidine kinase